MKVLLINGSPHEKGCTFTALSEIKKTLENNNIEAEIFHIGTNPVRGCIGCGGCGKNDGKCVFGDDVVNEDGTTNRPLLATRAFADTESTNDLNAITHPAVTEEIKSIIKDMEEVGYRGVIIDAIALFESGLDALCDFNVTVIAPKEIRLERIIKRDNITEEKALERINAQKDESFFTSRADFVLWNYPPYDINVEIKPITLQLGL
jgi:dephospho-CoA kinase